jgi:hypothetical protein
VAEVVFLDRTGRRDLLAAEPGERLEEVLRRNDIPPASALALREGEPVSDATRVEDGESYEVSLIEGYDIASIRHAYERLRELSDGLPSAYTKRRLTLGRDGSIEVEASELDLEAVIDYVEETILETCESFELLGNGSRVLVGLSGGVDSGSLLLGLSSLRQRWPALEIVAVTFEDFDMDTSPTFAQAAEIAELAKAEHVVAPADLADEIFHLNRPLRDVLPALMETPSAHHAMYVDSHTTRRVLEVVAEQRGIDRIALGLHASDLVAGLLNGFMTGYPSGSLPARTIRELTFVYPLAFLAKRELHLYFLQRVGRLARHTTPNPWEHAPLDRNFYYYLADQLQSNWPSLETLLLVAQRRSSSNEGILRYGSCANCGSAFMQMPLAAAATDECDVCRVLRDAGFID